MQRIEAIKIVSQEQLKFLDKDARKSHILNWWVLDEDDIEFTILSKSLQAEILANEDFKEDPTDTKYDELIMLGLSAQYKGVRNEFIALCINSVMKQNHVVTSDVEKLYPCPCCSYCTLEVLGEYEICPLCSWEDDGTNIVEDYSGVNGTTLAQAKIDFILRVHDVPLSKYLYSTEIIICDECTSQYYKESSKMASLCPECSSKLYGLENCEHLFENGRCIKCYWNGKSSEYLER